LSQSVGVVAVGEPMETVLLAAHLWRYRDKPGADWFLASLASQTVMSLAYGVRLLVFDPHRSGGRWRSSSRRR
jgi:hypothetical protein